MTPKSIEYNQLQLKGFSFEELLTPQGLLKLDQNFLRYLSKACPSLTGQLLSYREGNIVVATEVSQLLLDCSPILEDFIAELFAIEEAVEALQRQTLSHNPIFAFKKYFILNQAKRMMNRIELIDDFSQLDHWLHSQLLHESLTSSDRQLAIAQWGMWLLEEKDKNKELIDKLIHWCILAMTTVDGQQAVDGWEMFHLPKHFDFANLVSVKPVPYDLLGRYQGIELHHRDGFKLTDARMSQRTVMDEVHYCVYCHKNEGDFCSKGFPVKKGDPEQGLKINPVGEALTGCPLEEKVSEMHVLKQQGLGIAALAMIMVDNPMCPATGHRICNECMKACIFQKQEPVNIPQTETRILTDVLDLPWGVEIYDLLARWNPLRQKQWVAQPYNGLKILIMGQGPAGFTLAHHLLMEGCAVVGVDGLKIEPLAERYLTHPIYSFTEIQENLDDRIMAGFGGVAEYGITVRWDKNFLKLIYISLMRRPCFQVFGNTRFGGTLTIETGWALGFDHIALAVGAGLPKELSIPNSLALGMRQANDFLMALQLTGAAKKSSLANLQVRLPAVVIGGGLTGVDTATEVQAYYIAQVEKVRYRYQKLVAHFGVEAIRSKFSVENLAILDEFLAHGQQIAIERQCATKAGRLPNLINLIHRWGGVTIAYRKEMQQSPAYQRNYEELRNALAEGVYYAEGLQPKAVLLDSYGHVLALKCRFLIMDENGQWMEAEQDQLMPARSIFVATGARLNVAYEFEHSGTFIKHTPFEYERYEFIDDQLQSLETKGHVKIERFGPFTSYAKNHRKVSFLGDTHPIFHGNVVKAIASAKRTYPLIMDALANHNVEDEEKDEESYPSFRGKIEDLFSARVIDVKRLHVDVVEIVVRAPLAARSSAPGQFYRLQNYEQLAPLLDDTRLQMEALSLLAIPHPEDPNLLSFIIFERGTSSRLAALFQPGDPIALMGPTGAHSKVLEKSRTILVIGGAMAAIYLLSIAPAVHEKGGKLIYIGCFKHPDEIILRDRIEQVADFIFSIAQGDYEITEVDIVTALDQYVATKDKDTISLSTIDQVFVIGPCALLSAVRQGISRGPAKKYFSSATQFDASVYGPMQCMLKGVCAQCLQWQIDPATGQRTKAVYACSWQHQPLEKIDIHHIDERLGQNRCQEVLSQCWLELLSSTQ